MTAIAKDANNNAVSGATVAFSSSAGILQVTQATTDSSGAAVAVLSTGGDQTNQVITVTASSGTAKESVQVTESGTTASITGPTAVGSGAIASYTVTLVDAAGAAIANTPVQVTSSLNNPLTQSSPTTNSSGQVTVTYTGTTGGNDTLTASALSAAGKLAVAVSSTLLVFQTPASGTTPTINFGVSQPLIVLYTQNSAPVPNATLNFTTTRGTFNGTSATSVTATTNASGIAQVSLSSDGSSGAGGVTVNVAVANGGPSTSLAAVFNATTPATISTQASPSTVATGGTSTIKVLVRDASNNLVAGQSVKFTLSDTTGGSLSQGTGVTDQNGSASVTYTAGSTTSATNGVVVTAAILNNTAISSAANLTIGGQALFIKLGTTYLLDSYDPTGGSNTTEYQLPYTVIVTDSAGNPAPENTVLNLKVTSRAYIKGEWGVATNAAGTKLSTAFQSTSTTDPDVGPDGYGCLNEDLNNNGVFDPSDNDYNHDGKLEPGNVATVPATVTLDSTGSGGFLITYPKSFGLWVELTLEASAVVAGTESTAFVNFVPLDLATDLDPSHAPPSTGAIDPITQNLISPFGYGPACSDAF